MWTAAKNKETGIVHAVSLPSGMSPHGFAMAWPLEKASEPLTCPRCLRFAHRWRDQDAGLNALLLVDPCVQAISSQMPVAKACHPQNKNANEPVTWLNERDPLHQWSLNDDVYCLHCDGVFKAQDVAQCGDCPTCPVCRGSTPIDFAEIPWWREDLIDERATKHGFVRRWRIKPVQAVAGKPTRLPPQAMK